ncbi:conserved protein of unknown function [Limnospira indica PCC 8005]|uniref:Uncharacterized protein n=1 Tax=Limnospira indica PCC 8005 TaxID=376219 RepID=A0A9P1KCI9_9CYAN|nr:conserved protein of unknown function [Limnospira indica PCC 8005]
MLNAKPIRFYPDPISVIYAHRILAGGICSTEEEARERALSILIAEG